MKHQVVFFVVASLLSLSLAKASDHNLAELEQRALRAATTAVADSVVQIRTVGGLDRVGKKLLSQGPTTGLIISADGYIVSSAFNFAGQPSSIIVRLSDGEQLAAELVARDSNRMLVLLKVATQKSLPVPVATPREQIRVGQWAVALGRTFQTDQVGVSIGIVSALNRMYGRVIQTDASVSVANYGGPLVDISGQVLGVLVPMSPQASTSGEESELAGAEFYDSGIGFAVPLQHILQILERWKAEENLLPGKLGIGLAKGDVHVTPPKITSVWPSSPAAEAAWQAEDLITAIDGVSVTTQAQLRFQILPHYAGDSVNVSLQRGEEELETQVTLAGKLAPYRHPFLGILPARDSEQAKQGAEVRIVWPESPAKNAGIKSGDRLTKINETDVKSTAAARAALAKLHPQQIAELTITRDDEELSLSATLTTLPEEILSAADLQQRKIENTQQPWQAKSFKLPEFSQEAQHYVHDRDEQQPVGLLLWLGDGNPQHNQALADAWQFLAHRDKLAVLIAPPEDPGSWTTDDLAYLEQLVFAATKRLKLDRRRLVVVGQAKAGQLAYALAMKSRSSLAGVISIDAPLPRTLKPPAVTPRKQLAVLTIESRDSNFAPLIHRDVKALREVGYPTTLFKRSAVSGNTNTLDSSTFNAIARWIDGLDRY